MYLHTASNHCLLLQKEQNVKGGEGLSEKQAVGINNEACIGVIGIRDICHFTSRDIGYYPFYFQGYRILCSISGILCFLPKNKKKHRKNNSKRPFERRELKKKTHIRKIFLTSTTLLF